jgi:hypothetical protein
MSYPKLYKMIERLHVNTVDGTITWKETNRGNSFEISFSEYSVIISEEKSKKTPNCELYVIEILDQYGETVEKSNDEEFDEDYIYEKMKDIYQTARRQAKGVDKALDAIINKLYDGEIPF